MSTFTGQDVFAKVMQYHAYATQPKAVAEVLKPFILNAPVLLADQLQDKVSLASLARAQRTFLLQLANDEDFIQDTIDSMPEEAFAIADRETVRYGLETSFQEHLETLDAKADDSDSWLEGLGVTEEQIFMGAAGFLLIPTLLEKYKAGQLTIEDVLRDQPTAILSTENY